MASSPCGTWCTSSRPKARYTGALCRPRSRRPTPTHYRRGLIKLLDVLEFRSNNAIHRPVLDALDLIKRHADARFTYYPAGETVPSHKGGPRCYRSMEGRC